MAVVYSTTFSDEKSKVLMKIAEYLHQTQRIKEVNRYCLTKYALDTLIDAISIEVDTKNTAITPPKEGINTPTNTVVR